MTVIFLNLYRFQGSMSEPIEGERSEPGGAKDLKNPRRKPALEERWPKMYFENCTARWKTSCKKPVAKAERPEIAGMRQFCSWSQEKSESKIVDTIL